MYLIPAPAKLEKKEGRFIWAYDRYVTVDQSCSQLVTRQASLFCDGAEKELGYRPLLTRGAAKAGDVVFKQDDTMKAQSYVLDITEDAIVLTGDEAGLWHGMQTLLQIIEQEGACLSALHIEDAPAIVNRGYYFDCTRGRIPKLSWLKQLADRMAYYKLNQLQLYVEHSYLFRGMTELWRDDTPLTAEEIMEFDPKVLQYLDVLVDGPFVEEKKDLNLRFRGSSNQRVIDVKASLESKTVILLEV